VRAAQDTQIGRSADVDHCLSDQRVRDYRQPTALAIWFIKVDFLESKRDSNIARQSDTDLQ